MTLDLAFVRNQFPTTNWQWAFFENAGGAFVPNSVIERMTAYMTENQVQPGYPAGISAQAAERMNTGHKLMAEIIGADIDEATISASTSINAYVLAQALRHLWQPGDEILVSTLNHEANSGPWRRLEEFGLKIVDWPVTQDAKLDMTALDSLLNERTRLVAFPHVSNITGELNDVETITQKAHEAGALVCVDGVAAAPHRAVEVKRWDVDLYLFSYYKVFGPHMGCLYGKRDVLLEAKGQYHYFFPEDDLLHKFNPAGPNHESIASLVGIADYFDALCDHHGIDSGLSRYDRILKLYDMIAEHEQALSQRFIEWVKGQSAITLIGPKDFSAGVRVPTFAFTVAGHSPVEVAEYLAGHNIAVGKGHFYAKRLLDAIGFEDSDAGVVRCSMAHYNTLEEVDKLTGCLEQLLA